MRNAHSKMAKIHSTAAMNVAHVEIGGTVIVPGLAFLSDDTNALFTVVNCGFEARRTVARDSKGKIRAEYKYLPFVRLRKATDSVIRRVEPRELIRDYHLAAFVQGAAVAKPPPARAKVVPNAPSAAPAPVNVDKIATALTVAGNHRTDSGKIVAPITGGAKL